VGYPDWSRVVTDIIELEIGINEYQLRTALRDFRHRFNDLSTMLNDCGVEQSLIQRIQPRINNVKKSLKEV